MNSTRRTVATTALSAFLFAALAAAPARAQDLIAVKGGRVHTMHGPVLENATVLIENGRITKIGPVADIEVPWEAKVLDATGKVVLPTWVLAHSQGGARGANERMENVAFVKISDALDPASPFFEDCLRSGIGTVHSIPGNMTLLGGSGIVVRPFGRTVEDMAVSTQSGLKLSLQPQGGGRLLQIRKLRRALEDAREYLADFDRRKAEFEQEQKSGAIDKDKKWTEEWDRTKKPVLDLLQKKTRGWLYVPGSAEVPEAMRLQTELDLVLVLGPQVHRAVDLLKAAKHPVVLDETLEFFETDPETRKETKIRVAKPRREQGHRGRIVPHAERVDHAHEQPPGEFPTGGRSSQRGRCVVTRNRLERDPRPRRQPFVAEVAGDVANAGRRAVNRKALERQRLLRLRRLRAEHGHELLLPRRGRRVLRDRQPRGRDDREHGYRNRPHDE